MGRPTTNKVMINCITQTGAKKLSATRAATWAINHAAMDVADSYPEYLASLEFVKKRQRLVSLRPLVQPAYLLARPMPK